MKQKINFDAENKSTMFDEHFGLPYRDGILVSEIPANTRS